MKLPHAMLALVILGAPTVSNPLRADETSDQINALKKQIEELDQKVKVLNRTREIESEAAADKAKQVPAVSLGSSGFSVRTPDSNFVFKARGYVQADARFYPSERADRNINDTFLIRRARPIFEGTVYQKFDYRLMLDLGSGASSSAANNSFLQDAYVNARFLPELQVQVGKFKEPVGLERLQSGANLLFIERAYPTQLVPNRDVGVQIHGDISGGLVRYEAGIFNGVADGGSSDFETSDSDKDFAGRLFAHPFRKTGIEGLQGVGLGVAGTYGKFSGPLRSFVSAGQQRFFSYRSSSSPTAATVVGDGDQWRLAPQAYYYWGPFGVLGEWVISSQQVKQAGGGPTAGARETLAHTGWQVAASYFLTGEENSYKPVIVKRPLDFSSGGLGALELAARVSALDVDEDAFGTFADPATSASEAFTLGAGLNWHLNRNIKLSLDYEHTDFKGPRNNPFKQHSENVIFSRAQVSF